MSEEQTKYEVSAPDQEKNENEVLLENTLLKKKFKKKINKKTIVVIAILLTAAATFTGKILNDSNQPKISASLYELEQGDIEQRISATGIVTGSDSAEISSNLNLEIRAIHVKEGDRVKKGDVLANLDNKSLQSDYDMALKDVEIAKKQLEEQRSSSQLALEERQIDYAESQRQNQIAQELFQEGAISEDELVQSNIMLEKAEFALTAAKDALEKASDSGTAALGLKIKEEVLATKKDNLDKANITSPIDGTVTRVNAKIGRIPSAQDQMKALFIVENLDQLLIEVTISEYDISHIQLGQKARVTSDILGFGESIEGEVYSIAPTGESIVGSTTKEMRIPVKIKITANDSKMIAGVNAKVDILVAKKEDVLYVPLEAILDEGEASFILLGNDSIIKKIPIEKGLESISNVEIFSSELSVGDKIILNPSEDLTDGSEFIAVE